MRMNKCIIYLLVILLLCSCSGTQDHTAEAGINDRPADSNYHKKNFDSLIVALDNKFNWKLEFTKELMGDTGFVEIYEHSSLYIDDMIKFLSEKRALYQGEKPNTLLFLCIWSMQISSLADYIRLCSTLIDLYEEKVIREDVLYEAITPSFKGKWNIPHNYSDPNVIALLRRIHDHEKVSPELRKKIEEVLAGKFN